jgi:hypothetical protein
MCESEFAVYFRTLFGFKGINLSLEKTFWLLNLLTAGTQNCKERIWKAYRGPLQIGTGYVFPSHVKLFAVNNIN